MILLHDCVFTNNDILIVDLSSLPF